MVNFSIPWLPNKCIHSSLQGEYVYFGPIRDYSVFEGSLPRNNKAIHNSGSEWYFSVQNYFSSGNFVFDSKKLKKNCTLYKYYIMNYIFIKQWKRQNWNMS